MKETYSKIGATIPFLFVFVTAGIFFFATSTATVFPVGHTHTVKAAVNADQYSVTQSCGLFGLWSCTGNQENVNFTLPNGRNVTAVFSCDYFKTGMTASISNSTSTDLRGAINNLILSPAFVASATGQNMTDILKSHYTTTYEVIGVPQGC